MVCGADKEDYRQYWYPCNSSVISTTFKFNAFQVGRDSGACICNIIFFIDSCVVHALPELWCVV